MIDPKTLTDSDIGRWIEYRGSGGERELGKLKSWNDKVIFVVFKCDEQWDRFEDFTGEAVYPADLF